MTPNYLHTTTGTSTIGNASNHVQLVAVNVNTGAASAVVTITDATSGVTIAVIDASAAKSFWYGGIRVAGGIKVVISGGTPDVTVSYV